MTKTRVYAVLRYRRWNFQGPDGQPLRAILKPGSVGYIEVFGCLEDAEEAVKAYDGKGGADIMPIDTQEYPG